MLRPKILLPLPAVLGNAPTNTAGGGTCGQPDVWVPLQVEPSITDTVRSSRFPTKTVFLSRTIPTARGAAPTAVVGCGCEQLEVLLRLQVAPLMMESVSSSRLET